MENNFLNFKKKSETETELYIYGNIEKKDWIDNWLGTGKEKTDAFSLKDALTQVDTPNLTVRINSYGGSVSEGLAIYSLLSEFEGHLKTIVDGFACSAASVIFMAGQERVVPENGLLMIHNAWSYAEGDANTMRKMAEDLEKITQPSLNIYVNKTGLSEEKVKDMMDREEWITSKEAFELGFSTTQTRNEPMQALEANFIYNLVMKNKNIQSQIEEKAKEMADEILKEKCKGTSKQEPVGLYSKLNNKVNEDSWESFFNTKFKEKEGTENEN
jgi:ATP-dependent Clp protease protease subunit|nr:MAG TPA: Putative ATP dependent Clp protease [Caudoviricetes sp.]